MARMLMRFGLDFSQCSVRCIGECVVHRASGEKGRMNIKHDIEQILGRFFDKTLAFSAEFDDDWVSTEFLPNFPTILIDFVVKILTFSKKLLWHFYTRAKMIQYNQAKERHVEKVRTHRSRLRSDERWVRAYMLPCMCSGAYVWHII